MRSRTTRSFCSIPRASSARGTAARRGSWDTPRTRPSASTSRSFTVRRTSPTEKPQLRAGDRYARGPRRRRRLAHPQRRHALLGQYHHHAAAQRQGRDHRLREGDARHDRAPRTRKKSCARAPRSFNCSSPRSATTPSSCSIRTATSPPGTAGAERIKGYKPEEIIGSHFSAFLHRGGQGESTSRSASWRSRASRAASKTKAGACAKTARASGRTSSSPPSSIAPASCAASRK